MKIAIFLTVIFILTLMVLSTFFYHTKKKQTKKDNILVLMITAVLFSLLITMVIALLLLIVIGSASAVDIVFSLNISRDQLVIIGIAFLIYLLTLDHLIEKILEFFYGKNLLQTTALAFTRIAIFYVIGILIHISQEMIWTISIGVSVILWLLDVLYDAHKGKEKA